MEIRVDRELDHIDVLTILTIAKDADRDRNSMVIYKAIGNAKQLPSEELRCPGLVPNPHRPPKQTLKFIDKVSKIHNFLYAIDFIFPILDFNLSIKDGDKTLKTILSFSNKLKSVKFSQPIVIAGYYDLILEYSYDPASFSVAIDPKELNISKLLCPCYTVGLTHLENEILRIRLQKENLELQKVEDSTQNLNTALTINTGDVIIQID